MNKKKLVVLVGFGSPRSREEIEPFLRELLTDREMVRVTLPKQLHRWLFSLIAKCRTPGLARMYEDIGGHFPIFEETNLLAVELSRRLDCPVLLFHRYLPATQTHFLDRLSEAEEVVVFPLYPQYSCVTTGSAKMWMEEHVPVASRFSWISSYADHPAFITAWVETIRAFLDEKALREEEIILLFSAHGLPQKIVDQGDPYEAECQASFRAVANAFPKVLSRLSYQSRFGFGRWLQPSTKHLSNNILSWHKGRKAVIFVPISFTSDHIETLYEIEYEYLPLIHRQCLAAYRCPALALSPHWLDAICHLLAQSFDSR